MERSARVYAVIVPLLLYLNLMRIRASTSYNMGFWIEMKYSGDKRKGLMYANSIYVYIARERRGGGDVNGTRRSSRALYCEKYMAGSRQITLFFFHSLRFLCSKLVSKVRARHPIR